MKLQLLGKAFNFNFKYHLQIAALTYIIWKSIKILYTRIGYLTLIDPGGGQILPPLSFIRNCSKFRRNLVTAVDWLFNIRNYASIETCLSKIGSPIAKWRPI